MTELCANLLSFLLLPASKDRGVPVPFTSQPSSPCHAWRLREYLLDVRNDDVPLLSTYCVHLIAFNSHSHAHPHTAL